MGMSLAAFLAQNNPKAEFENVKIQREAKPSNPHVFALLLCLWNSLGKSSGKEPTAKWKIEMPKNLWEEKIPTQIPAQLCPKTHNY